MNIRDLGYGALRPIVTGGAGFIGSHVADAPDDRGGDVLVLPRRAVARGGLRLTWDDFSP
jgi:nucleoside-diphosphate-sugar epimerase